MEKINFKKYLTLSLYYAVMFSVTIFLLVSLNWRNRKNNPTLYTKEREINIPITEVSKLTNNSIKPDTEYFYKLNCTISISASDYPRIERIEKIDTLGIYSKPAF